MESEDLIQLVELGEIPGAKKPYQLIETHISWVLLTPEFAFKFKKPVNLGFLDFSSLEKRQFYCQEELRLNQRLAAGMYLAVLPLVKCAGQLHLGCQVDGEIIDYAVQMQRMDETQQLDVLVKKGAVVTADLRLLAAQLAAFHLSNRIKAPEYYSPAVTRADFDDLFRFKELISGCLGEVAALELQQLGGRLSAFFERYGPRLQERAAQGFWVDGHGDLHCRNIFLLPGNPVVFDCIEFSSHFRQLDVLSELAFLCMDFDFQNKSGLSNEFIRAYQSDWAVLPEQDDEVLFRFFKAYRANVRLKVILLQWQTDPDERFREQARCYFRLILKEMPDQIGGAG